MTRYTLTKNPANSIHTWTTLISLLCDVIEKSFDADAKMAADLIGCWLRMPYPIFRRLAVFGMSKSGENMSAKHLRTLLANEEGLLWPYYTREFAPTIVAKGCKNLTPAEFDKVIEKLVAGPPRSMFRRNVSDHDWAQLLDGAVLAMLEAIESQGLVLPELGRLELQRIRTSWESEKIRAEADAALANRSDDYRWTDEKAREFEGLPEEGVFDWIIAARTRAQTGYQLLEGWALKNPLGIVALLGRLATAEIWHPQIWKRIVSGAASASPATNAMAGLLERAPAATVLAVAPEIARWLSYMDHRTTELTPEFLEQWDLVYKFVGHDPAEDYDSPLMKALNSPAGQLCRALLEALFAGSPQLGSGLPTSAKERIARLLDKTECAESTRIILCAYLYGLHVVDRHWTRARVLPLFDWAGPTAVAAWRSYLYNPRWYPDLMSDIKPSFLEALGHRQELQESARYLCILLANVAIDSASSISEDELTHGIQRLDREGVVEFVDALVRIVNETDEDKRAILWKVSIRRLIERPLDQDQRSPELPDRMVDLALALQNLFNEVADAIKFFMSPVSSRQFRSIAYRFAQTELPERFPESAMKILAAVIPISHEQGFIGPKETSLLERIRKTNPALKESPEYSRLERTGYFELG